MQVYVSVCAHMNIPAQHLILEWIFADWAGLFITKLIVPIDPCFTRPCLTHNSARVVLEAAITLQKDTSTTQMGFIFLKGEIYVVFFFYDTCLRSFNTFCSINK